MPGISRLVDQNSVRDKDSVLDLAVEMVVLEMGGTGFDLEEVHVVFADTALVVAAYKALVLEVVAAELLPPLWGSIQRANTPLVHSGVGANIVGAGCLWGWHMQMWRVLAGCRKSIADDDCKDLTTVEVRLLIISDYEDRWEGTEAVVAAVVAGVVGLEQHKKTAVHYSEVDIEVWEYVILSISANVLVSQRYIDTWWTTVWPRCVISAWGLLRRWALIWVTTTIAMLRLALPTTILRGRRL